MTREKQGLVDNVGLKRWMQALDDSKCNWYSAGMQERASEVRYAAFESMKAVVVVVLVATAIASWGEWGRVMVGNET